MIDSSVKNLGEVDSIISRSVLIRKFLLWTNQCTVHTGSEPHFKFFDQTWVVWCCRQFCLSYLDFPRVFTLESIISKSVSIGNFLVMDQSMYSAHAVSKPHLTPPNLFDSILRGYRQLFSQSLAHKIDRAEHGLSFKGNFSLSSVNKFWSKNAKNQKNSGFKNLFSKLVFSECIKIQKYGHFQNPLVISNRLVYTFIDFERNQTKIYWLKHFRMQNSNFLPYHMTKI